MKPVDQLLKTKPTTVFSVEMGTSVLEGLQLMMQENISALLVIENGKLEGVFTERDYARKIVLKGRSSKDTPISEVMSSELITVSRLDTIDHCMQVMTSQHIRHLPVIEANQVVGMISIGDLVKFVIEEQRKTIEHLEKYINS
jgi:signal-transduction protein with cAMP-binding, CBS, and nucleotidyltransferase domain